MHRNKIHEPEPEGGKTERAEGSRGGKKETTGREKRENRERERKRGREGGTEDPGSNMAA